ncbi:MAG: cytochrome c oxidase assembly protein [Inquilinus sp.]|nr:cytochrome c oxidase assembly protein [Inquilinus sp.]
MDRRRRNTMTALGLSAVVLAMVGLSFAAVPLYDLFCSVTGYGGTTRVASAAPTTILDRTIRVRFAANTDPDLPWRFRPAQREIELRVGEQGIAFYEAHNTADRPITGMAVFNVTPAKAGAYFNKIHCFCFDRQTLAAGERVDMPVSFFVDPALADDPGLDEVRSITLSYTFFRAVPEGLDEGEGETYNTDGQAAADGAVPALAAAAPAFGAAFR